MSGRLFNIPSTSGSTVSNSSYVRDCSFEIREGGRTIWGDHKISNIVFGGFENL